MKNNKKVIAIVICVILILLSNFIYDFLKVITIGIEILKINKSLPAVSCDFYSNPIEDVTYKDIVFKKRGDTELKLDIYSANKEIDNGNPVIIYVYGDGWIGGSKTLPNSIKPLIDVLRNEGYTIISTSYELMKDAIIFDKQISDIKDTIRWVNKYKDEYSLDTSKIGIISPSAGAQLSMVAAYSDKLEFKGEDSLYGYNTNVNYIVDLFGPSILSEINLSEAPKEIVDKLTAEKIEELSKEYSPMNYLKEGVCDTLVIHSKSDRIVPYNTSLKLYNKAIELNNDFELYSLENSSHYLDNLDQKEAFQLYFKIISFIIKKT